MKIKFGNHQIYLNRKKAKVILNYFNKLIIIQKIPAYAGIHKPNEWVSPLH